ncbi:MAG: tripartite tricarboxylate transporter substrate binding protein, partial [Pseudolabrys sp.]|nr:tripartite tricarboxylate transporter substrate binding protein [Pseudolabrys sp.]
MLTRRDFNLALGAFSLAGMGGAFAQSQAQPIRIMVGHAAGGGVDFVARLLSEPIKTTLNQNVVVENRTGASAMLATSAVAKAAPDGKTLLMGSGEMGINPQLHKGRMPYEPQEIVPIALVGVVPCVVAVNSASTIRAPQDVVKEAKANPGKLTFSSSGVGNPQQLAGELMNTMAGIQVIHVPYRGAAPA